MFHNHKKIKANPPLLYSTLNPDTNSDSPSAKSEWVRIVSAKHEVNHYQYRKKIHYHDKRYQQFNTGVVSILNALKDWLTPMITLWYIQRFISAQTNVWTVYQCEPSLLRHSSLNVNKT
jgi:hypothetical protein